MPKPTLLQCGCWKNYSTTPALGDEVFCRKHNTATVVVQSVNVKVSCRNCPYVRNFGNAPVTAESFGVKHSLKYSHEVRVIRYANYKYVSEYKIGGNRIVALDETLNPG